MSPPSPSIPPPHSPMDDSAKEASAKEISVIETETCPDQSGVFRYNDGRGLFQPASFYEPKFRREQFWEGVYIWVLFALSLGGLAAVGLGALELLGVPGDVLLAAKRYSLLALGGLLGGLVYGGKWLYHSIARGLWHQDRRMWRVLSPWISVATTIGIWALIDIGFFPPLTETPSPSTAPSLILPVGVGFLIGFSADKFLAKMKELLSVLFGQYEELVRGKSKGPS